MKYIITLLVGAAITYIVLFNTGARPNIKFPTPEGSTVTPISIVSLNEIASNTPDVEIEYPQFDALTDFNQQISSTTLAELSQFKQNVADNIAARQKTVPVGTASIPMNAYSFIASWQESQINSRYISVIERYGSYSGGANGNEVLQTFNYDLINHKFVTLGDLFGNIPDYLNKIATLARTQLTETLNSASNGHVQTDVLAQGTAPTPENYSNFTFTDKTITFYFPKYAVAPGYFGEQKVIISRSDIH